MSTPEPSLGTLERAYQGLLLLSNGCCHLILIVMTLVIGMDVGCRYVLGFSTQIAEETASLGLVALIFLSLPGAFDEGLFLRIDIAYARLSKRLRRLADFAFHLTAVAVTSVYLWFVIKLALNSYKSGMRADTYLATPNYLPQTAMALGLAALLIAILAGLVRRMEQD